MVRVRGPQLQTPLTRHDLDRGALRRSDPHVLDAGEDAFYLVTRSGAASMLEDGEGRLVPALEEADPRGHQSASAVYLGDRDGRRVIAVELPEPSAELDDPGRDMRDLRRVVGDLGPEDAALAVAAVAMGSWHRSMRHCPLCGALLEARLGGWVLVCSEDGTEHFPRTDPAVIMAVRDEQDRLLLARNASFRSGFHSVLAGFVEPGETIEAAVAREVAEEVSLVVEEVEYVGSQPWPFPRSLMLAFRAWAADGQEIVLADGELASARWFTREELTAAVAAGEIQVPNAASVGRALVEDWYGGPIDEG
jgi:NAD+ diphosphatase